MKILQLLTYLIGMLISVYAHSAHAQSADTVAAKGLSDKVFAKSLGEISTQQGIKGYYLVMPTSKAIKGRYRYLLSIYDTSLTLVGTDIITGIKKMVLEEASCNGDLLLFRFYAPDANEHFLFRYTLSAKPIASNRIVGQPYNRWQADHDLLPTDDKQRIFPLEGKGFLFYQQKSTTNSIITFIPNGKGEKGWVYEHSEKQTNMLEFIFASPKLLLSTLVKWRGSLEGNKPSFFVLGIDLSTGKKAFVTPSEKDFSSFLPMDAYMDEASQQINLMGVYYYNVEVTTIARQPNGIAKMVLNSKGEIVGSKFISWINGPSSMIPINTDGHREDLNCLYVHRFVRVANGKIAVIAEQYKKDDELPAGKKKKKPKQGKSSKDQVPEFVTKNIVMFELSRDFELLRAIEIEKEKNLHLLPLLVPALEAHQAFSYRLKRGHHFGYSFALIHDDHEFVVGYKNYSKKADKMLFYTISFNQRGEAIKKNIGINPNMEAWKVLPGKEGHILFAYLDDDEHLVMKLEGY